MPLERVKFWCEKFNSQGCKLNPKCWLPGVVSTAALGASYLKPVEFCRCGADVSSQLLLRALQMITMLCQLVFNPPAPRLPGEGCYLLVVCFPKAALVSLELP